MMFIKPDGLKAGSLSSKELRLERKFSINELLDQEMKQIV